MRNPLHLDVDYSARVFGLDLYRAVAILLVVFAHGGLLLQGTPLAFLPGLVVIDGVDLFFALSGFLIGGILLKIANREQIGPKETIEFWKRRWFRTLPNYYLILVLNYLFVRYGLTEGGQFGVRFLVFAQNLTTPTRAFHESWSLAIEEWFYIVLPLLVVLFSKFFATRRGFFLAVATLLVAPLIVRMIIAYSLASVEVDAAMWDERFRKIVVTRIDTIGFGVLAAWIKYYYPAIWGRRPGLLFIVGIALLYGSTLWWNPNGFYSQTIPFTLSAIGAVLLLPLADSVKTCRGRVGRCITHVSLISYSMYLINYGLVVQPMLKHFAPHGFADAIFKYGIYWVVVVLASTLLYKYFEKPMMDLRDQGKVATQAATS
jgi:peptidoglycan/LPS O-acetylase OafA/YrhL